MQNIIHHPARVFSILSLALALCSPVFAESGKGAEKSAEGKAVAAEKSQKPEIPPGILKKYDANKDGVLDESEAAKWEADKESRRESYKEKRAEDLAKYDADHDGQLNKEEKEAMKAAKAAEREAKKAEKNSGKTE